MEFARLYWLAHQNLMGERDVDFSCRGLPIHKEIVGQKFDVFVPLNKISIFSHPTHRVTPIKFALAELCYILAGRDDVESIASYNKSMAHFSDDGMLISGSYGKRLENQLPIMLERLMKDVYTRQACATIFSEDDGMTTTRTHLPCNVFLQFLCRPPYLDLMVTSRSSDFVTGFSIDTIHWQMLLVLMANELNSQGLPTHTGFVRYFIGSLHIYKADMATVKYWSAADNPACYEHVLKTGLPLSFAIRNCKKFFQKGLSAKELANILGLYPESVRTVERLDEMFKEHRNKIER